jgi:hypothetical protein
MRRMAILIWAALSIAAAPALAQHRGGAPGGPPAGHWSGNNGGWDRHEGWHGDIRHFDHSFWQGGHWWHGPYGGRQGWWWIVGPNWYWYPTAVYPYPDPYLPPGGAPGFWYYCDAYRQYYPYVGACPSGWRAVPAG